MKGLNGWEKGESGEKQGILVVPRGSSGVKGLDPGELGGGVGYEGG